MARHAAVHECSRMYLGHLAERADQPQSHEVIRVGLDIGQDVGERSSLRA